MRVQGRIDANELRALALQEADELGPEPADPGERELWRQERSGTVILLAALADYDSALLRRAGLEVVDASARRGARTLLVDAAAEAAIEARRPQ